MQEKVVEIVRSAFNGSRRINIVFDPECKDIINQFLELVEHSFVEISEDDTEALLNIAESASSFDHHYFLMAMSDNLDIDWFIKSIVPGIETITPAQ
jgi:hypothetical protein